MKMLIRRRGKLLAMHLFFVVLAAVSLRHLVIPGDVLWTTEGDFVSWPMRLHFKGCTVQIGPEPGQWTEADLSMLSKRQANQVVSPFVFRQYVRKVHCPRM